MGRDSDAAKGPASERGRQDDSGDRVRSGPEATPGVRETSERNADGLTSSQPALEGTTFVGKSATGGDLFERPDGVRKVREGDFVLTEPMMMRPTRAGIVMQPAREISRPEFLPPEEYKSMGGKPLASTAEPVETQAAQLDVSTIINEDDNEPSELRDSVGGNSEGVPSGDRPQEVSGDETGQSPRRPRNADGQGGRRARATAEGAEPGTSGQRDTGDCDGRSDNSDSDAQVMEPTPACSHCQWRLPLQEFSPPLSVTTSLAAKQQKLNVA